MFWYCGLVPFFSIKFDVSLRTRRTIISRGGGKLSVVSLLRDISSRWNFIEYCFMELNERRAKTQMEQAISFCVLLVTPHHFFRISTPEKFYRIDRIPSRVRIHHRISPFPIVFSYLFRWIARRILAFQNSTRLVWRSSPTFPFSLAKSTWKFSDVLPFTKQEVGKRGMVCVGDRSCEILGFWQLWVWSVIW